MSTNFEKWIREKKTLNGKAPERYWEGGKSVEVWLGEIASRCVNATMKGRRAEWLYGVWQLIEHTESGTEKQVVRAPRKNISREKSKQYK